MGGSTADDTFHADVVLIWHANPAYTRIPYFHYLTEARYRGAEVVLIAPDVSPSAVHADYVVPVKPGSDSALALAMCHVVTEDGLVDESFVRTQTDLPLLVRRDTGQLLRASDLEQGGGELSFFGWVDGSGVTAAPDENLFWPQEPALGGTHLVRLADGSEVEVSPVFELLVERLAEYRPEDAAAACGVHPETIRMLARKVAGGRTKLHEGFDTAKHYHGDLMERSMNLLLALTGNWGRKGSGHDTYCTYPFDGTYVQSLKGAIGLEAAEGAITVLRATFGSAEPGEVPPPLARPGIWDFLSMAAAGGSTSPPFFLWLDHCGYREVWERAEWGDSPRPFGEYLEEALPQWAAHRRPGPDVTPRVMIEGATNALRRTRGGARMLLENLWPELRMVVSVDQRINSAGLHADILLPAAHEAERVNLQYPISHSMEVAFSDRAIEPAGEARSDWQIYLALAEAVAARAVERGMADRVVGWGAPRPLGELGAAFGMDGVLASDEAVIDELLRDSALAGVIPEETSLATIRERGWVEIEGNGCLPIGRWLGGEIRTDETFSVGRWHVEHGLPYATTTGRATFYIDHPWFLEADEALPRHKEPPAIGGDHPLVLTGGHPRWSIHACNATNPVILETTRGHPTLVMNPVDAEARGIGEEDPVELSNDLGALRVRVRLSPTPRPGQVILYAAWEAYGFEGWGDSTQVEAGMVKWLHLATGWGHLRHMPMMWQPVHFDRVHRVEVRAVG